MHRCRAKDDRGRSDNGMTQVCETENVASATDLITDRASIFGKYARELAGIPLDWQNEKQERDFLALFEDEPA